MKITARNPVVLKSFRMLCGLFLLFELACVSSRTQPIGQNNSPNIEQFQNAAIELPVGSIRILQIETQDAHFLIHATTAKNLRFSARCGLNAQHPAPEQWIQHDVHADKILLRALPNRCAAFEGHAESMEIQVGVPSQITTLIFNSATGNLNAFVDSSKISQLTAATQSGFIFFDGALSRAQVQSDAGNVSLITHHSNPQIDISTNGGEVVLEYLNKPDIKLQLTTNSGKAEILPEWAALNAPAASKNATKAASTHAKSVKVLTNSGNFKLRKISP